MRLYENEAKKVFHKEGIPVPEQYGVICSVEDLKRRSKEFKFPIMLKSLVLIGGRGKAGGIKKAESLDEAVSRATEMLDTEIRGYTVDMLMVEKAVDEIGACYLGVTMNPSDFNNIMMVSPSGGVDIEMVARENPEAILKIELTKNEKILPEDVAQKLTQFLVKGLKGNSHPKELKNIVSKVYEAFQKYDCKVAEVNPLIITPQGPVAADAKIVLDDNALFRQSAVFELLGIKDIRNDISEPTPNEVRAREAGFPYVDLLPAGNKKDPDKLYVGLVPGGAGYGIFSIDEVANVGDRFFEGRVVPVNFMDSGGGPSLKKVAEMFHLLMDYEIVDLIITSRFGGISSCDTYIRGLVDCLRQRFESGKRVIPVYGRMVGTDLPSARDFLDKAKREHAEELRDMHIIVGNQTIMADVIRQGVEKAFEMRGRKG